MALDDRIRSRSLKKLVNEIKIDCIKKGKKIPSSEKIVRSIIKKYKITKEEILFDKFIKF